MNSDQPKASRASEAPAEADILDAVRRTGYLLDQEVATALEDLGFHVQPSWPFEDPDEGHSRELDVWAVKRVVDTGPLQLFVELYCECKSGVDRPTVFLSRRKGEIDASVCPQHFTFPHAEYERPTPKGSTVLPAFCYLDLARHHYWFAQPTKAVQFVKVVRDKANWQAQHDGLYNALLLPLAKAITSRQKTIRTWQNPLVLAVPIVVLKSDIYEIDAGQQPLGLTKRSHVSFFRRLESTHVKGAYIVEFVTMEGLGRYVTETLMPFVEHVAQLVKSNPGLFLERRPQR